MKRYNVSIDPEALKKTMIRRTQSRAWEVGKADEVYDALANLEKNYSWWATKAIEIADTLSCSLAFLLGLTDQRELPGHRHLPKDRDEMLETLGCRLQKLAYAKKDRENITLASMAVDMEISIACFEGYRVGFMLPKTQSLMRLALYFGVSPDYLLGLTDQKAVAK